MVASLARLLELQDVDTMLDQLAHKRATLDERAHVDDLTAQLGSLDAASTDNEGTQAELDARQRHLERDVADAEGRAQKAHDKIYGGGVSQARELAALQSEISAARARQSDLEDELLDVMDAGEQLAAATTDMSERRATLAAQHDSASQTLIAVEAEIDASADGARDKRASIAPDLSAELLSAYDRLRSQFDGVAVARLDGRTCSGCRLELPAVELDRFLHSEGDEVVHCEQCGRILVRT